MRSRRRRHRREPAERSSVRLLFSLLSFLPAMRRSAHFLRAGSLCLRPRPALAPPTARAGWAMGSGRTPGRRRAHRAGRLVSDALRTSNSRPRGSEPFTRHRPTADDTDPNTRVVRQWHSPGPKWRGKSNTDANTTFRSRRRLSAVGCGPGLLGLRLVRGHRHRSHRVVRGVRAAITSPWLRTVTFSSLLGPAARA
jgi:hypothetical protein